MRIITAKTKIRNYPIYLDHKIYRDFPALIKGKFPDAEKIALVTDDIVFGIYGNKIKSFLKRCLLPFEIIIVQNGEEYKNLKSTDFIYKKLIDFNVHRNDILVAFGGGVIGDLAGFAASTFHRGIKLVQFPTTIISQVDSSIGGKVAVNYGKVKNIIGSFYQPHMIVIDPTMIYTLKEDQIINGLGEVVKYGLVFKRDILTRLSKMADNRSKDYLMRLIKTKAFEDIIYDCCCLKIKVVTRDEFDLNYRNLLNFGHTIGHCIENAFDLKRVRHGEAVSMGMIIAINISISLGLLERKVLDEVIKLYEELKLPYKIPKAGAEKIMSALKYDKKFKTSQNKFILLKAINRPVFYYNIGKRIIIDNINKSLYNYL
jgi:3-dehydroquinate synthase